MLYYVYETLIHDKTLGRDSEEENTPTCRISNR